MFFRTTAHYGQLSPELLCCIAAACDRPSLLQLRLVSRMFRDLLSPTIFQQIWIGFNMADLHSFDNIASSQFAKHVRKLTFNAEVLPLLVRSA